MTRTSIVSLLIAATSAACHGAHDSSSSTPSAAGRSNEGDARPPATATAEAPRDADGDARTAAPDAAGERPACDADAEPPYGCDYQKQVCVGGRCKTCGKGTEPLMTECTKTCKTDRDCPRGLVCIYSAGTLFLCDKPAPKRACPPGHIWLRSDGDCWKTCKTDRDCPKDQCCMMDPNSPVPICMGRC